MKTIFSTLMLALATILSGCGDRELPPVNISFENTRWECTGAQETALGITFRENWEFTSTQVTIDRYVHNTGALYDSNTYTWEHPEIGTLILNGTITVKINELYDFSFLVDNFPGRTYYGPIHFLKK